MSEVDYYTKRGAEILADRIVAYWRTADFHGIVVRVYRVPGQETLCYSVRSNIGPQGYPPRRRLSS